MLSLVCVVCVSFPTLAAEPDAPPAPETSKLLATFREEFVAITPGKGDFPATFSLGRADGSPAERPVHEVKVDYSFFMARHEVPQNLWEAVMGGNPSRWKGPRNAVEMLNFAEAEDFCQRATKLLREAKLIDVAQRVRLPSEAEWEYCARAGTRTIYSFGDDPKLLGDYAWFTGNAAGNDPPVGAKKPNAWGLCDMHGYLWEWCADVAHPNYTDAPANGTAWTTGGDTTQRVARGGSWKDAAEKLTSSHRQFFKADARDDALGLRCVLAAEDVARP